MYERYENCIKKSVTWTLFIELYRAFATPANVECGEEREEDEGCLSDGRVEIVFTDGVVSVPSFVFGRTSFACSVGRCARLVTQSSFAIERLEIRRADRGEGRGGAYPGRSGREGVRRSRISRGRAELRSRSAVRKGLIVNGEEARSNP